MMRVSDLGPYGRIMSWLGGLFLFYGALAFVPSPFSLVDMFEKVSPLEIRKHPALQLALMPPLARFDDILAHPLLNADRKPDPVAAVPQDGTKGSSGPALGDLGQYRLVGIAGDSVTRLALVRKTGGGLITLRAGDRLEGWTVAAISSKGISISGGGRKEFLTIPRAANNAKTP